MNDRPKKPGAVFCVTVAVVVGVLYVASSGPARMIACSRVVGNLGGVPIYSEKVAPWYRAIYRPLGWASRHQLGKPLRWYWRLFPVREEGYTQHKKQF